MALTYLGSFSPGLQRDERMHRTYKLRHKIKAGAGEGPFAVLQCAELPAVGDQWSYNGDVDPSARCLPNAAIGLFQEREGESGPIWFVDQTFSTRPQCIDWNPDNPLAEPDRVRGSFLKTSEEATHDRFGAQIVYSSHEQIRGPQVEFDVSRPQVEIEQNVADLGIATWGPMINCVNDAPMWGLPLRCVKLSSVSWERKYYGSCNVYYTRTFGFEINVRIDNGIMVSGFDRVIMDEGSKALNGHWNNAGEWVLDDFPDHVGEPNPDPSNPSHFIRMQDPKGNLIRVPLDGHGLPADVNVISVVEPAEGDPFEGGQIRSVTETVRRNNVGRIWVEKYPFANLLLLGVPLVF